MGPKGGGSKITRYEPLPFWLGTTQWPFCWVIRVMAAMAIPLWRRPSVGSMALVAAGVMLAMLAMLAITADMDGPFPERGGSGRMGVALTPFGQTRPSDRAP